MNKKLFSPISKELWGVLFLLIGILPSAAQSNSTESPYTRFGIGTISTTTSTTSRAMGGVAIALQKGNLVNPSNPAGYAAIDSQTFILDFASSIAASYLVEGQNHDSRLLGNLEYISMLFSLYRGVGLSIGLKPVSFTGYKYGTTAPLEGSEKTQFTETYKGKGNINDLYVGIGVRPFKGFSIGTNIGWRFGSIEHSRSISYTDPNALAPNMYNRLRISALRLETGLQYKLDLKKEHYIILGATYGAGLPIHTTLITQQYVTKNETIASLIQSDTTKSKDYMKMPHEIGLGLLYGMSDKFSVAMDVKYNIWSKAFLDNVYFKPQDQIEINLGAAFTPNASHHSLAQKIEYRFGLSGSNSYLTIPTKDGLQKGYLKGGISFGMGIPLVDRRSYLDLAFDYAHLMPTARGLISENYFRFTLGLRFNEAWFRPIRLD